VRRIAADPEVPDRVAAEVLAIDPPARVPRAALPVLA
jgi:hypothetical protein